MRYAFISDIHSNLEAFQAVIADMEGQNIEKTIFLGDAVGYGPNPNECVDLLKTVSDVNIGGNHDWAAVDLTNKKYFNPYAFEAISWTAEVLTDENKEFLKNLPSHLLHDEMTLAHASPKEPDEWHYVMNLRDAIDNYSYFETNLCFVGHSHLPVIIEYYDANTLRPCKDQVKRINPQLKYLINAGSIGQSRDGNKDACYLIYDSDQEQTEYRRIQYRVSIVQHKMMDLGLPEYLIDRLGKGR